jgi:hypothetical protein
MTLLAGTIDCTTGLAAAIYSQRAGLGSAIGLRTDSSAAMKADCFAIATAVVAYLIANAVVTVAPGQAVATAGTAAAQTGATTSAGTGAVS